jgi:hypothetical protein
MITGTGWVAQFSDEVRRPVVFFDDRGEGWVQNHEDDTGKKPLCQATEVEGFRGYDRDRDAQVWFFTAQGQNLWAVYQDWDDDDSLDEGVYFTLPVVGFRFDGWSVGTTMVVDHTGAVCETDIAIVNHADGHQIEFVGLVREDSPDAVAKLVAELGGSWERRKPLRQTPALGGQKIRPKL